MVSSLYRLVTEAAHSSLACIASLPSICVSCRYPSTIKLSFGSSVLSVTNQTHSLKFVLLACSTHSCLNNYIVGLPCYVAASLPCACSHYKPCSTTGHSVMTSPGSIAAPIGSLAPAPCQLCLLTAIFWQV